VDFQVWIADSKQPLPLRIVLNYPAADGHPQFWANFTKWNLPPSFGKTAFEFKPPAGAKQIVSGSYAARFGAPQPAEAQNQGGKP
jgi:hypothetical protein